MGARLESVHPKPVTEKLNEDQKPCGSPQSLNVCNFDKNAKAPKGPGDKKERHRS